MELNLEQLVKDRIEEMDLEAMVREEVQNQVRGDIHREIKECLRKGIESIIETEIKIAMKKGVSTDNGWGEKATLSSFEDLFRKTFAEKMKNTWEIQRKVEEYVKAEVRALIDANQKAVTEKIAAEILAGKKI